MQKISITDMTPNGFISVLTQTAARNHREALVPGQFERAREILPGDLYSQAQAIWTNEVVAAWEQQQAYIEATRPITLPADPPPDYNAFLDGLMEVVNNA